MFGWLTDKTIDKWVPVSNARAMQRRNIYRRRRFTARRINSVFYCEASPAATHCRRYATFRFMEENEDDLRAHFAPEVSLSSPNSLSTNIYPKEPKKIRNVKKTVAKLNPTFMMPSIINRN